MAETYSLEYTNLLITKPPVKTVRQSVAMKVQPFSYTQVLAGTAEDTCIIAQLPPFSQLYLPSCVFYHAGFTSGMTLSVGWKAYVDKNGVTQALSATGLFNAADISNGTGMLHGGMNSVASPDDFNPVSTSIMKDFENSGPVDIYVTFGAQVPGAAAVLLGYLVYGNIG
jgi:hypothetical protein